LRVGLGLFVILGRHVLLASLNRLREGGSHDAEK